MATISTLIDNTSGTTPTAPRYGRKPVFVENSFTWAEALAAKGSALAAADIVQAIQVPPNHAVLMAGLEVTTASDDTTLTLLLGVTGVDVDRWVSAGDGTTGGYAAAATTAGQPVFVGSTADTIDVEVDALTGTLDDGAVRVWAYLLPIDAVSLATSAN